MAAAQPRQMAVLLSVQEDELTGNSSDCCYKMSPACLYERECIAVTRLFKISQQRNVNVCRDLQ